MTDVTITCAYVFCVTITMLIALTTIVITHIQCKNFKPLEIVRVTNMTVLVLRQKLTLIETKYSLVGTFTSVKQAQEFCEEYRHTLPKETFLLIAQRFQPIKKVL